MKGVPGHLFEEHHIVGVKHDPELTILICRNCHAKVTEGLLRAGVSMRPEPDPVKRLVHMLDAQAVLFEKLTDAQKRWAEQLRNHLESNE